MKRDDEKSAYPFGYAYDEMDVEAFMNMRDWLQAALEAAGAKKDNGAGIGFGQADIDIELDGARFNVSIRPLPKGQ